MTTSHKGVVSNVVLDGAFQHPSWFKPGDEVVVDALLKNAPTGWRNLNALSLDVPIPGGAALSQAPMYAWDTIAGGTTIQAQALDLICPKMRFGRQTIEEDSCLCLLFHFADPRVIKV